MEILFEYGYWGMFVAAFLAATILPFSSEVVLGYLLAHGFDPEITLLTATAGNVLGSVVNYAVGMAGSTLLLEKIFGMSSEKIEIARQRFRKYGTFSLLFAWVPVVGDPLTVVAGILRIHFGIFLLLVGTGKCLRYIFVAALVLNL